MDHELKQRLIGAVVVTALCAIFIPMLFDDPVDNSSQLVSELSIPASVNSGDTADKLPVNADQVLNLPDQEPLSTETADDTLESTGAAEEVAEESEADQLKQGRSGESLYAESEGYTHPDKAIEAVKLRQKQVSAAQSLPAEAHAPSLRPIGEADKIMASPRDTRSETAFKETVKVKKVVEPVKPVTAAKAGTLAEARPTTAVKQPSTAKNLAAAVAEATKPEVAPKASPKLVRWYIQLGSFSKKENAMSFWDSLREQGLPASLDTIETDKGTAYRLRVGPELDGKKAAEMKARLDKKNIKGILMSE